MISEKPARTRLTKPDRYSIVMLPALTVAVGNSVVERLSLRPLVDAL